MVILLEKVTTKVRSITLSSWLRKGSKIPITSETGELRMVLLCWNVLIVSTGRFLIAEIFQVAAIKQALKVL